MEGKKQKTMKTVFFCVAPSWCCSRLKICFLEYKRGKKHSQGIYALKWT